MDKISPIKDRILTFLDINGISKVDFCDKCGISYANMKGKGLISEIGGAQLGKILSYYPSLSADWLITGVGDMFKIKCTAPHNAPSSQGDKSLIDKNKDSDNIGDEQDITHYNNKCHERLVDKQSIPLYDIHAAAGIVQIFQGDHSHIPAEYITIPRAPRCDGAMYVSGDSMYPLLKSGDIVMYSEVHNIDLYLQWGEMYIVAYGDDGDDLMVVVKYVQKADDPTMIRLVSHNQHHADKDIPKSAIRALARVKASIRFQAM